MTITQATAADTAAVFPTHMANVIDSLKRLERIGSEESETVKKILEAAAQLSDVVCKSFPAGLRTNFIRGYIGPDGAVRLGTPQSSASDTCKHQFATYCVLEDYREDPAVALRRVREGSVYQYVAGDRATALEFAKDLSMGLLDLFHLFIEKEHEASLEGLERINSARPEPAATPKN